MFHVFKNQTAAQMLGVTADLHWAWHSIPFAYVKPTDSLPYHSGSLLTSCVATIASTSDWIMKNIRTILKISEHNW